MRYIELNLRDTEQLFNSMDPSPFRDKDLDREAEEFIVSWSHELPLGEPLTLRVHLQMPPAASPLPMIREAVRNYFLARAEHATREFRQLMRQGRLSLVIGLAFLAVCSIAAEMVGRGTAVWSQYLRESLSIAGWVAMWRPMQIYLYDWWPVRRQIKHYARLASMDVEVVTAAPHS
jgi:hypothetical protein